MSQVEKNEVDHTTAPDATPGETQDQPKLSEEQQTQDGGIDYKAKLEQERLRREKAEKKIVDLKREKKEAPTSEGVSELEARLKELEASFSSRLEDTAKQLEMRSREDKYNDAINSVSSSEDEAELIKHILHNDIRATGDVARDVQRAKLLANEDRLVSENAELKAALASKRTAQSMATVGQRVQEDRQAWSAADIKFAKAAGLDVTKLGKRN